MDFLAGSLGELLIWPHMAKKGEIKANKERDRLAAADLVRKSELAKKKKSKSPPKEGKKVPSSPAPAVQGGLFGFAASSSSSATSSSVISDDSSIRRDRTSPYFSIISLSKEKVVFSSIISSPN